MNYIDTMRKYTDYYNTLDKTGDKHTILFGLLTEMYKNKFNKNINIGVLLQTLTNIRDGAPLPAVIKLLTKEKMEFDEKNNEIIIGEVFSIKETIDLDYNPCISVELIDKANNNHNKFLLGKNENVLVINHPKKHLTPTTLTQKAETNSSETRTFDSKGIEIKREIFDTVTLGVDNFVISFADNTIENSFYQRVYGLNNCMVIKNETTLERDPNCFLIAKLESKQEITSWLPGDYEMKLGLKSEQLPDPPVPISLSKTCYVACHSGYSLGASSNKFESYDDAIASCADFFESFSDDFLANAVIGICPPCTKIPSLNNEIKQRFENAKVYSLDYLNQRKKI